MESCGFSPETIRLWATDFLAAASSSTSLLEDDECMLSTLETNRGYYERDNLLRREDFCLAAWGYIRSHPCKKGEPNMTSKMFMKWIHTEYGTKIHDSTACCWLQELGFSRVHHQKGVYFDGHDRDDVVRYRQVYLQKLEDLYRKSLTCFGNAPLLALGEKPLILVTHDECTYYANCDQTYFWADEKTNVLRQKSLGASIMLSDFIDEEIGFHRDSTSEAHVLLETSKDGYFTKDNLMEQVENAKIYLIEYTHMQQEFLFLTIPLHTVRWPTIV